MQKVCGGAQGVHRRLHIFFLMVGGGPKKSGFYENEVVISHNIIVGTIDLSEI